MPNMPFTVTVTDKAAYARGPIPLSKFTALGKFFRNLGFPMLDALQGAEIGATIYATTESEINRDRENRGMCPRCGAAKYSDIPCSCCESAKEGAKK